MDFWYLLATGVGEPAWNMAVDEYLLRQSECTGRAVLRFYGWSQSAATFGYFQEYKKVADLTRVRPLIRRPTGGGLVEHVSDWTYSVAVPPSHVWYRLTATESYLRMHGWLCRAFRAMGEATELAPTSDPAGPGQCFVGAEKYDLLRGGRKIAGAAQRRNRQGLLIQGSVQVEGLESRRAEWEESMVRSEPGSPSRFEPWELSPSALSGIREGVEERFGAEAYNHRR